MKNIRRFRNPKSESLVETNRGNVCDLSTDIEVMGGAAIKIHEERCQFASDTLSLILPIDADEVDPMAGLVSDDGKKTDRPVSIVSNPEIAFPLPFNIACDPSPFNFIGKRV